MDNRALTDLVSVGEKIAADLRLLGVRRVEALKSRDPQQLYDALCEIKGAKVDICCLDVFVAAVEQARDPHLTRAKCNWWYWSRVRKARLQGR